MNRPLIGLSVNIDRQPSARSVLNKSYVDAVFEGGGMPVLLPVISGEKDFSEWVSCLDGLILTGGGDINPLLYDCPPERELGRVDMERDLYELALLHQWLKSEKPLLGICRGIQVMQVAAGGKLIQDIHARNPEAYLHRQNAPRDNPAHTVEVTAGSLLANLLETDGCIQVNSIHHQAIDEVAQGFCVSARSGDGIIEAIESQSNQMILGVQWHPEEMTCPIQKRLFKNFISCAGAASASARSAFDTST